MKYTYVIATILICLVLGIGPELITAKEDIRSPYKKLWIMVDGEEQGRYVEVLCDLKKLVKQHGDDSRLLRYIDEDAKVIIYLTQNSTGDMFTSMQVKTFIELNEDCNLKKRY